MLPRQGSRLQPSSIHDLLKNDFLSYYIGNPAEYFYGVTFDGGTYAGILTGAQLGYYRSSSGPVDIVTGDGTVLEAGYTGSGEPTETAPSSRQNSR